MFTSRTSGALRGQPWVTSLYDLKWFVLSETVSSSAHCTQEPPGLVSKNNVFFVSKNPWYVLAGNSKNSAFPPCPSKLHFTPTAHYFFLCTPLSAFLSLPLPGMSLGLGIMPVWQVHYPDYRVFVFWKSGVSVSLCSDQIWGLKCRHNSPMSPQSNLAPQPGSSGTWSWTGMSSGDRAPSIVRQKKVQALLWETHCWDFIPWFNCWMSQTTGTSAWQHRKKSAQHSISTRVRARTHTTTLTVFRLALSTAFFTLP